MSDSVRPHRQQPTRLPRPWDSPSKNTGVGCHFLLQCMKVESESEVVQSRPTLSDPIDCSAPGSSVHGIFQARVLEWGAIGQHRPRQLVSNSTLTDYSQKWTKTHEKHTGNSKQVFWINLEGWDGERDGREVQNRGDICIPMADSCWCLRENNKIL